MNDATINLRDAHRGDVPFLVECNAAMASETEHKTLDRVVLTRGTHAVFDEPRRGFYLVAERKGEPVGCLLVTFEWSDWRNGDYWWIQSVYVVPQARRDGVFRALYAEVERRARAAKAASLRLYVETENARAQATYERLGMRCCHYAMYEQVL